MLDLSSMPEEWLEADVYARVEVLDLFFGRRKMHSEMLVKKMKRSCGSKRGEVALPFEFSFLF